MPARRRLFAGLAAALICTAVPAWGDDHTAPPVNGYAPADVARFFIDVALGPQQGARLVKWHRPPRIRLETLQPGTPGDLDDDGRSRLQIVETPTTRYQALDRQVRALSGETGLALELMPRDIGEGGDIVITIVPRLYMRNLDYPGVPSKLLERLMGPSRCFFIIWPNTDWHIEKARIVINSKLEYNHIKHCFTEELTQAMGLPNDSARLTPSVFNEQSKRQALTPLDALLVRTLYDPRVRPGAGTVDLVPILEDLIRTDMRQH